MYVLCGNTKECVLVEKKSQFFSNIFYVENEEQVKEKLEYLKKYHFEAKHHVYAYVINDKKKMSDDGEPSGTGGKPLLALLENNNLNKVLLVVSRIFGGILLGTGGLMHAYSDSAKMAIDASKFGEVIEGIKIHCELQYTYFTKIKSSIIECEKSNIIDIIYGDNINLIYEIPKISNEKLINKIMDITNGSIKINKEEECNYIWNT